MELNALIDFGVIFLIITLIVGPRLTNKVLPGQCHQADDDVANNKKWYIIFLIVSSAMILGGLLMMFL